MLSTQQSYIGLSLFLSILNTNSVANTIILLNANSAQNSESVLNVKSALNAKSILNTNSVLKVKSVLNAKSILNTNSVLNVKSVLNAKSVLNTNSVLNNFTYRFTDKDDVKSYDVYGVTVGEVEVDILTGQHQVRCLYIVMCWGGLYCYVLRWTLLLFVEKDFIVMH